ncbi:MAG: Lrp/AsnC ligand binding domain-containing protein [Promethearchaeati archaeon SRVP18_Atabeyarchaeia-1]
MNIAPGKVKNILRELRRISNIREVSAVTGHCDIIASIDVGDMETFSRILLERIQTLEGITRTETLVCVPAEAA